jgi:prepilin-type N-terminal cleavage/methylation domain-containing protein
MARRSHKRLLGFTLVELMIAMAVGSFAVAVAAAMARVAVRKSGQGAEESDMVGKARVLGHQIRTELKAAGQGSTGAIGVDASHAVWGTLRRITPGGGFPAIPAVSGVDNHPGGGSQNIVAGSDVLQIVAVDSAPDRSFRTDIFAAQGSAALPGALLDGAVGGLPCSMAYLSDSSASNGAGRTQLMHINANSDPVTLAGETLVFDVPPGAVIMCARVSTYFVSDDGSLWRSDFDGVGGEFPEALGGPVYINTDPNHLRRLAPGVMDLQVAYRLSSEAGLTRGGGMEVAWAFDPAVDAEAETALGADDANWFEVRQIQLSMQLRSGRRVDDASDVDLPVLENRATPLPGISRAYRFHQVTTGEVLLSLRFFDQNMLADTPAEPW